MTMPVLPRLGITVQALLAILFSVATVVVFVMQTVGSLLTRGELQVEIPAGLLSITTLVVGYYFGDKRSQNLDAEEPLPDPVSG